MRDPLGIRHDRGMPPNLTAGYVGRINPSKDLFLATHYLLDERGVIGWI